MSNNIIYFPSNNKPKKTSLETFIENFNGWAESVGIDTEQEEFRDDTVVVATLVRNILNKETRKIA